MSELDRITGVLLGLAAGDALGAGYETRQPPIDDVAMIGGGLGDGDPGEWTDDTAMAICIAEVTATGSTDPEAIGERFLAWARSEPPDIGVSTRAVLEQASDARELPAVAAAYHAAHPHGAAGNGALMRTAPVALAHLGDDQAIADTARRIAELTHADPLAGDSCVLWCIAIDRAVRERRLDGITDGLRLIPPERRGDWDTAIDDAVASPPGSFRPNGYTVTALQAAYAAIVHTPIPDDLPGRHLQLALEAAVRIGDDTDTVAAIAGALLGARWGTSAVPFAWRRMLHGWPGATAGDLLRLAVLTAARGSHPDDDWPVAATMFGDGTPPYIAPLPGDDGVLLGNLPALDEAAAQVDAVVSLCRVGRDQVPSHLEHHEVWLTDDVEEHMNPNLDLVLVDAAAAVDTLRREGKRVFLHCAAGRSRTPTVAAIYLARRTGTPVGDALRRVAAAIPDYFPHNTAFLAAIERLDERIASEPGDTAS